MLGKFLNFPNFGGAKAIRRVRTASSLLKSPLIPPSTIVSQGKYDVFLSFRGEDTRFTFTSHLNAALGRLHIKTFMDNEIQRGDEIPTMLVKAIEEAKVSIIVFSRNYAFSKWCLDELEKIIECKIKNNQIIVPVFYHVDPSHVRNQTGCYREAFEMHEQQFRNEMIKVQRWKFSLVTAGRISGWDCSVNRYLYATSFYRLCT